MATNWKKECEALRMFFLDASSEISRKKMGS